MEKMRQINKLQEQLANHSIYKNLNTIENLKVFMKWHAFAVWDFMSLLKSLQREITCVSIPWRPSIYPKDLVRFINEIVLGEESDVDHQGNYSDHFSMYINAMDEIQSDTSKILGFIESLELDKLPLEIKDFVKFNLELSHSSDYHRISSAFFFGREKLIPEIFGPIVEEIKKSHTDAPMLLYYLERHIELDGEEHGELASKCLEILCRNDENLLEQAYETAISSLNHRSKMWDFITREIETQGQ